MERMTMKEMTKRRRQCVIPARPSGEGYGDDDLIDLSKDYIDNVLFFFEDDKKAFKEMDIELKNMALSIVFLSDMIEHGFQHIYINFSNNMFLLSLKAFLDMGLIAHAHMMVEAYDIGNQHQLEVIESYQKKQKIHLFDAINRYFENHQDSFRRAYIAYARRYFC